MVEGEDIGCAGQLDGEDILSDTRQGSAFWG